MKDEDTVLLEGLKLSVDLYKHEDELNWSKFRHGLYAMFFLAGAYWYAYDKAPEIMLMVSILGIFGSVAFYIALHNGLDCIEKRGGMVSDAQKALVKSLDVDVSIGYKADPQWWAGLRCSFYLVLAVAFFGWIGLAVIACVKLTK